MMVILILKFENEKKMKYCIVCSNMYMSLKVYWKLFVLVFINING